MLLCVTLCAHEAVCLQSSPAEVYTARNTLVHINKHPVLGVTYVVETAVLHDILILHSNIEVVFRHHHSMLYAVPRSHRRSKRISPSRVKCRKP